MVTWFNETDTAYRSELRELNELNFARFDAKLEQRVAEVKAELRQEMAQLRTGLAELRGELRAELQAQGKTLIKWMFVFWMGQAALMVGLVLLVVGRR